MQDQDSEDDLTPLSMIDSGDVLTALGVFPNSAEWVLAEMGLQESYFFDIVAPYIRENRFEPPGTWQRIAAAADAAVNSDYTTRLHCFHLLWGIVRHEESIAHRALRHAASPEGAARLGLAFPPLDFARLRQRLMTLLVNRIPRPLEELFRRHEMQQRAENDRTLREAIEAAEAAGYTVVDDSPRQGRQESVGAKRKSMQISTAPTAPKAEHHPAASTEDSGRQEVGIVSVDEVPGEKAPTPFDLDPGTAQVLVGHTRNLTAEAFRNADKMPLVGREREIERMLDTLGKFHGNNVLLVGEPGVGKSALVMGLVQYLLRHPYAWPRSDRAPAVLELSLAGLTVGTPLRGALAERMNLLRIEMEKLRDRAVLFIDNVYALLKIPSEGGDPLDDIKQALAQGRFPCIATTTPADLERLNKEDPVLLRRFQIIDVPEPNEEESRTIARAVVHVYAQHHAVRFREETIDAAVRFAVRHLTEGAMPTRALQLLDLAGSRTRRQMRDVVEVADVAEVVRDKTDVPVEHITLNDGERLMQLEEVISAQVVGHQDAIERIAMAIRRNAAGFGGRRPIGSFLFLGPTGVGKTELARALGRYLFGGSSTGVVRIDMSEFHESHTVSKLIGAPPGYVGHDAQGQLTGPVAKRPFQLVLLDEFEKAHEAIWKLLLQVLDEGRLTDGHGRTVSFHHTLIVMTSNIGASHFLQRSKSLGFAQHIFGKTGKIDERQLSAIFAEMTPEQIREAERKVIAEAMEKLPPELWNRIDEKLVFLPQTRDQVARVGELLLRDSAKRLLQHKDITFSWNAEVIQFLIDHKGFDPRFGSRPMRSAIEHYIESPLANLIVTRNALDGDHVEIVVTTSPEGKPQLELVVSTRAHNWTVNQTPPTDPRADAAADGDVSSVAPPTSIPFTSEENGAPSMAPG